ncbi:MAG TPA: YceI family protein [Dehalococcoidia bacterium]|nr:YceI family protein [Dehalococcoidia bacterium]
MITQVQPRVSTWTIDPTHTIAEFSVKHMMVSTVKGRFRQLSGTIQLDEDDPTRSSVEVEIDTASVDTALEERDNHLRSDDFFNAERFPTITFHSTGIDQLDDDNYLISGDLTIRDVTKEVVLATELEGQGPDAYGGHRAGFTATTTINRHDFGLNWNALIEAGGVAVGDKVKITLHVEAIRQ